MAVNRDGLRRWLASGDSAVPRIARRALRSAKRSAAGFRSGSVAAEMDRIVAEAVSAERGSGLTIGSRDLARRRRGTGAPR